MLYKKGKHIIATIKTPSNNLLNEFINCKACIDNLIKKFSLVNLGEVYHNFSPNGFTAVVCLSESHISLHTWPEHNLVNLDIYLSNYLRDNNDTVEHIFNELVSFFKATIINQQTILR
ncbi:MAG: S-adenosylmethionine decarboxylase family protein [Chitinophagaceae bacterium]